MDRNVFLLCILCVLTTTSALGTNRDEGVQAAAPPEDLLTVEQARAFFESSVAATRANGYWSSASEPGSSLNPGDFTPLWDQAHRSALNDQVDGVDVEIDAEHTYSAEFIVSPHQGYTVHRSVPIVQKLVINRWRNHPKWHGLCDYIVSIIPTPDYYAQHKNFGRDFVNLGDKNGFSGFVIYHRLDGSFVNADRYVDGEMAEQIYDEGSPETDCRAFDCMMYGETLYGGQVATCLVTLAPQTQTKPWRYHPLSEYRGDTVQFLNDNFREQHTCFWGKSLYDVIEILDRDLPVKRMMYVSYPKSLDSLFLQVELIFDDRWQYDTLNQLHFVVGGFGLEGKSPSIRDVEALLGFGPNRMTALAPDLRERLKRLVFVHDMWYCKNFYAYKVKRRPSLSFGYHPLPEYQGDTSAFVRGLFFREKLNGKSVGYVLRRLDKELPVKQLYYRASDQDTVYALYLIFDDRKQMKTDGQIHCTVFGFKKGYTASDVKALLGFGPGELVVMTPVLRRRLRRFIFNRESFHIVCLPPLVTVKYG